VSCDLSPYLLCFLDFYTISAPKNDDCAGKNEQS
jgi:hypothetical protein